MAASEQSLGAGIARGGWQARSATSAFRALIARLEVGRLDLVTPEGERLHRTGTRPGPHATLVLHSWRAIRRTAWRGFLGFAEGYIEGEWSTPDLAALLEFGSLNCDGLSFGARGRFAAAALDWFRHLRNANTKAGSRRNITAHYDLGNAFYGQWLDAGMNYSSALWSDNTPDLEAAQEAKLTRVAELLDLGTGGGLRVLEIGCGWGGLAQHLVEQRGCTVTGVTLSPAQLDFARARVPAQADFHLCDYRDLDGRFDRIASIEMLEAVGEAYWPTYFRTLANRLLPGGKAVLQVITINEADFLTYRRGPDFIQRYIFPGGMLPTISVLGEEIARAGLRLTRVERFGDSYARTLGIWNERFQKAWPAIADIGFDTRFKRLWEYYLAYCEAGFRTARIDVCLLQLDHAPTA